VAHPVRQGVQPGAPGQGRRQDLVHPLLEGGVREVGVQRGGLRPELGLGRLGRAQPKQGVELVCRHRTLIHPHRLLSCSENARAGAGSLWVVGAMSLTGKIKCFLSQAGALAAAAPPYRSTNWWKPDTWGWSSEPHGVGDVHGVEESTVVGHQEQRAVVVVQGRLELLDGWLNCPTGALPRVIVLFMCSTKKYLTD